MHQLLENISLSKNFNKEDCIALVNSNWSYLYSLIQLQATIDNITLDLSSLVIKEITFLEYFPDTDTSYDSKYTYTYLTLVIKGTTIHLTRSNMTNGLPTQWVLNEDLHGDLELRSEFETNSTEDEEQGYIDFHDHQLQNELIASLLDISLKEASDFQYILSRTELNSIISDIQHLEFEYQIQQTKEKYRRFLTKNAQVKLFPKQNGYELYIENLETGETLSEMLLGKSIY